ncbi:MAG: arginine N-succinyltransferase [Kordiimonas sp.]
MIIRLAQDGDLPKLLTLSQKVASGMTTVPQDSEGWNKLITSTKKFISHSKVEQGSCLLVLEDTSKNRIAGFTAIHRNVGMSRPFFTFKKSKIRKANSVTGRATDYDILFLTNDFGKADEIGTLFLDPEYQGYGTGRFLSLSRFLFMAIDPTRYSGIIFAEMRGYQNGEGISPVWEALGKHFFDIPFEDADRYSAGKPVQFITDSFPEHPIIVDLLPQAAQDAIGKPHRDTVPAYKLLKSVGFLDLDYVDIFDGGPTIFTPIENIKPLRESKRAIAKIGQPERGTSYMIALPDITNFTAASANISLQDSEATINQTVADKLGIKDGDQIIFAPLR